MSFPDNPGADDQKLDSRRHADWKGMQRHGGKLDPTYKKVVRGAHKVGGGKRKRKSGGKR